MRASGLDVTRRGLTYYLERRADPPPFLVALNWRMTAAGLIGSAEALRDHWQTWPHVAPILDPAGADAALQALEARQVPMNMLPLAERMSSGAAMLLGAA